MSFETIRKSSAPEKVVDQIMKKIRSGELPAGSRLPSQRDLAAMFGVGRSSVREATNALAVMGYLDVMHGRGTFIRKDPPSSEPSESRLESALKAGNYLDLMEARELLESKSAELAAERADAGAVRMMKNALARCRKNKSDYAKFLQADLDFHMALAEAAGNTVIREMIKSVIEMTARHHREFRTSELSADYREQSIATAEKTVEYAEKGDGKKAAHWMRKHLNTIRRELEKVI
jgi:GntR family transcriptional repressor for pyruvate dehydrogenase complex